MERGELVKAEKLFRRLIEAKKRVLGHDRLETLSSIFGLVRVLCHIGKLANAEALSRNLLQDSQRIFENTHVVTRHYTRDLTIMLDDQEKYSEALPYYEKVYTFDLATFGPDNPKTLESERDSFEVRGIVDQQLQSEQTRSKRTSLSGSQNSDLESDARSEASEPDDEFIFSIYEQTLLGSSEDAEQALISIPTGGQDDKESVISTEENADDLQMLEAAGDESEASENATQEEDKLEADEILDD
ncbi:hypothetical protein OCU04_008308 [Sclerotinia nivalis]|uniref:Uncharacterized protein n=1 Tax=Sclerotinia nivalis TaxID=352851 RepID=A0A9X0AHU0_9HELO|nr:hypothetical protein OCU04_008308 [Sclerotinia nivalis]